MTANLRGFDFPDYRLPDGTPCDPGIAMGGDCKIVGATPSRVVVAPVPPKAPFSIANLIAMPGNAIVRGIGLNDQMGMGALFLGVAAWGVLFYVVFGGKK